MLRRINSFFLREKQPESKLYTLLDKILKFTKKNQKELYDLLSDENFDNLIEELTDVYWIKKSKYSTKWIEELKNDILNDKNEKIMSLKWNFIIFLNKYEKEAEEYVKQEIDRLTKKKISINNDSNNENISLNELYDILDDKNTDPKIINYIFRELISKNRSLWWLKRNKIFVEIFEKTIKHPKIDKKILLSFLLKTSITGDKDTLNDMETYEYKKLIIKSKVVKANDIIKLSSVEYIWLWKDILDTYILWNYLLPEFLEDICNTEKYKFNIGKYMFILDYYENNKDHLPLQAKIIIENYLNKRKNDKETLTIINEEHLKKLKNDKNIFDKPWSIRLLKIMLDNKNTSKNILIRIWEIFLNNIKHY